MDEKTQKQIQKLLESGIPVWRADFQAEVENSRGEYERFFSLKSTVKSRIVTMTWTSAGLICEQDDKYFCVPQANVRKVWF